MAILANNQTRVLVQGLTGKTGSFHSEISLKMGTKIVAGAGPGKGGQMHLGVPLFETVEEALRRAGPIDASLIYVPAPFAYEAMAEAIDSGISLIVVITEGIAIMDMVKVKKLLADKPITLIGPNCPGLLVPGETRLGIIPETITPAGKIGIVSRSGTLTYEAAHQIAMAGLGVSTVVGIGGDPVIGTDFIRILDLFAQDPQTEAVLLIGEIGGPMEEQAARHWNEKLKKSKPLFSLIAGKTAPKGKRMGHAGAIMEGTKDSAQHKAEMLSQYGVSMVSDLTDIGAAIGGAPAAAVPQLKITLARNRMTR
ncbi:MAG: succinate--CoA ligase subunit alpha [Elusimicrobia bacterium]|nr:succinate--CoA ligase subunit alpha [Elusimicrobiota bacterium]